MDNLPRTTLINLVQEYGRPLCDDPQRCSGLLKDFCGVHRREIHALVESIRERVPAELTAAPASIPPGVTISRLSVRLQDNLGLSETVAQWAVESWAIALEIVTEQEVAKTTVPPVENDALVSSSEDHEPILELVETEMTDKLATQFNHPTDHQPQSVSSTTPAISERDRLLEQGRRHLDADRFREGIDLLTDALERFPGDKEIRFLLGEARHRSLELMMLAVGEERWFRAKRFLLLCQAQAQAESRKHVNKMVADARRFGQFFLLVLLGFFPWVLSAYPTFGHDGFQFSGQLAIAVSILPFGALAVSGRHVFDSISRLLIIGTFAIVVVFVLEFFGEEVLDKTTTEWVVCTVFGVLTGCVLADLARRLLPRDEAPPAKSSNGPPISGLPSRTRRPVRPPPHPVQRQGAPVTSSRPPPHPSQIQRPIGAPVRRQKTPAPTEVKNELFVRFLQELQWIGSHYVPGAVAGGIAALALNALRLLEEPVDHLVLPMIIIFGLLSASGLVRRWTSFAWIPVSTTIVVCILTLTGVLAKNPILALTLGSMFIALSVLMSGFQETTGKAPLGIMLTGLASVVLVLIAQGILPEEGRFVSVYIGVWFATWGTLAIRSRNQLLPCLQVIDRLELWMAGYGVLSSRSGHRGNSSPGP